VQDWDYPFKGVLKNANELDVKVTTPMIGETLQISKFSKIKSWWKF
jgi:hypothetical protein